MKKHKPICTACSECPHIKVGTEKHHALLSNISFLITLYFFTFMFCHLLNLS